MKYQRNILFGMCVASMPFFLILTVIGFLLTLLCYLLATRKVLQLNIQLLTSTCFMIIEPEELSAIEAPEAGHNIRPTIKTVIKQAKS